MSRRATVLRSTRVAPELMVHLDGHVQEGATSTPALIAEKSDDGYVWTVYVQDLDPNGVETPFFAI